MKRLFLVLALVLVLPVSAYAGPRLTVTGVTHYDPAKSWNGFTLLSELPSGSAKLIDMNGNLVHEWDVQGGEGMPNKLYPGGYLLTSLYPAYKEAGQGHSTVAVLDFEGNIVRQFKQLNQVKKPSPGMVLEADGTAWISRQHHDYQIQGDPVGYYSPGTKADIKDGNMLILAHRSVKNPKITDKVQLQDDRIVIIDKSGKIIWDWAISDHFDELKNMGDNPDVMKYLNNATNYMGGKSRDDLEYNGFDWFHMNCASWLGPNKWYDAGDQRFHPDNIIADSRVTSHMIIIDHKTGKIVWQVAPPYTGEDADIGVVIGVHHTHMIPKGLPGEGNIMIFDNGGYPPYHDKQIQPRAYSRVVEFDPTTKKVVWEYSHKTVKTTQGGWPYYGESFFYSPFISSAQRLPNGNTMICEGNKNRIFEVNKDREIVWEYVSPYGIDTKNMPLTYRAYRVPYDYVPQLPKGGEVAVNLPLSGQIQIPNINGKMPDIMPKVDKAKAQQLGTLHPVTITPQKPLAPVDAAEDEPAMKAY